MDGLRRQQEPTNDEVFPFSNRIDYFRGAPDGCWMLMETRCVVGLFGSSGGSSRADYFVTLFHYVQGFESFRRCSAETGTRSAENNIR